MPSSRHAPRPAILTDPDAIPPEPGAYALVLRLNKAARLAIPRLDDPRLKAGWYVYAGSAYGPGGLRARVRRHLRRVKPRRWHIDHLTAAAPVVAVAVFAGGDECAIVDALARLPDAAIPVRGFGSTDCPHCPAHLLAVRTRASVDRVLAALDPAPANLTRLSHG